MTPRMKDFLERAARAEEGKGVLVKSYDRRIAGKAVSDGFGWLITAPFPVFMIDDDGRAATTQPTE